MQRGQLLRSLRHRREAQRCYRRPLRSMKPLHSERHPPHHRGQHHRTRHRHRLQVLDRTPRVPVRMPFALLRRGPVLMAMAGHFVRVPGLLRTLRTLVGVSVLMDRRQLVRQPPLCPGREVQPASVVHRRMQHRRHHEAVHQDGQSQACQVASIVGVPHDHTLSRLQSSCSAHWRSSSLHARRRCRYCRQCPCAHSYVEDRNPDAGEKLLSPG
jgi:hypothetical protein